MAMVRMFCEPTECCVQPSAYRMVMVLSGPAVSAIISQTFEELVLGRAGDLADHLRRVAAVVLLHQLEHAVRVLQGRSTLTYAVPCRAGTSRCPCVAALFRVVAGEDAVIELEVRVDQEGGVGVALT